MERKTWVPDTVIGIDFGMTCTGVAYSSREAQWARPEVIQSWPHYTRTLFDKYPSRVGYDRRGQAVDWGTCTISQNVVAVAKEFKLYLDPTYQQLSDQGLNHDQARHHYVNYMKKLYEHINKTMPERVPRWHERKVEYRFSIPTTWKNPRLTQQLKELLAEAGFTNLSNRRIHFSRTEAEAAAVYVADQFQEDDVIMIVDAGGATTDLNILKITKKDSDVLQMEGLDKAEGINIGGVMIDIEAKEIIKRKLQATGFQSDRDLGWIAEAMMEDSGYDYFKRNYSNSDAYTDHYMKAPGREDGDYIILKSSELRRIFECLLPHLIITMREKIRQLAISHPTTQLKYIVLSGGLGSSAYLFARLSAEFRTGAVKPPNAAQVKLLVADQPQLAVVRGLVMDRIQMLESGVPTWTGRCCRVSYGVITTAPYDKNIHYGEPTQVDPLTKKRFALDQIDWLIKEGELVPEDGVTKKYALKLANGRSLEPFYAHVVMSELPKDDLPRSKHRGPVRKICTVEGKFDSDDFVPTAIFEAKWGIRGKSKEHYQAHFYLKIFVSPTDLSFEFMSLDGSRSYSESSSKVFVQWQEYNASGSESGSASVSRQHLDNFNHASRQPYTR